MMNCPWLTIPERPAIFSTADNQPPVVHVFDRVPAPHLAHCVLERHGAPFTEDLEVLPVHVIPCCDPDAIERAGRWPKIEVPFDKLADIVEESPTFRQMLLKFFVTEDLIDRAVE